MARVTGIGGVFFRTKDPEALKAWYSEHLGIETDEYGASFQWRDKDDPETVGMTVWGVFRQDTEYFGTENQQYMVNYRVDDLHAVLESLRAAGVEVDDKVQDEEYGRFGWFTDPDGRRVELWEPPPGH